MAAYFVQECPTCGRNLQVRVDYMGKRVVCQHCSAKFQACDPDSAAYPPMESSLSVLARADQLLLESAANSALNRAARTAG
jgi:DNA-directed RNA polymerase subunit RPC12/RpoP